MIDLVSEPIDVTQMIATDDPTSGGVVVFVGTVRNQTGGREVSRLEYEAYPAMAKAEMAKVAERACAEHGATSVDIVHRVGTLQLGEAAVAIVARAPHRAAAFDACRFAIDTLKQTVPIWKKEVFGDGEVWVGDRP